jgi:hypothetical protein
MALEGRHSLRRRAPEQAEDLVEPEVDLDVRRIGGQAFGQHAPRALQPAVVQEREAEVAVQHRHARIEPARLLPRLDGRLHASG